MTVTGLLFWNLLLLSIITKKNPAFCYSLIKKFIITLCLPVGRSTKRS